MVGRPKCWRRFRTTNRANPVLARRSAQLSNRFEDYWADRAMALISQERRSPMAGAELSNLSTPAYDGKNILSGSKVG